MKEHPYQVINPSGNVVLRSTVRHSRIVELDHLAHGYTILLNGKKLTKTDLRREVKEKG
jgi:hypothetical protein